jgi:hypothetical protein
LKASQRPFLLAMMWRFGSCCNSIEAHADEVHSNMMQDESVG